MNSSNKMLWLFSGIGLVIVAVIAAVAFKPNSALSPSRQFNKNAPVKKLPVQSAPLKQKQASDSIKKSTAPKLTAPGRVQRPQLTRHVGRVNN